MMGNYGYPYPMTPGMKRSNRYRPGMSEIDYGEGYDGQHNGFDDGLPALTALKQSNDDHIERMSTSLESRRVATKIT